MPLIFKVKSIFDKILIPFFELYSDHIIVGILFSVKLEYEIKYVKVSKNLPKQTINRNGVIMELFYLRLIKTHFNA